MQHADAAIAGAGISVYPSPSSWLRQDYASWSSSVATRCASARGRLPECLLEPILKAPRIAFPLALKSQPLCRVFQRGRTPHRPKHPHPDNANAARRAHASARVKAVSTEDIRTIAPGLQPATSSFFFCEKKSLDPRDLVHALPRAARAAGVTLIEQTTVSAITVRSDSVQIRPARTNGTRAISSTPVEHGPPISLPSPSSHARARCSSSSVANRST